MAAPMVDGMDQSRSLFFSEAQVYTTAPLKQGPLSANPRKYPIKNAIIRIFFNIFIPAHKRTQ